MLCMNVRMYVYVRSIIIPEGDKRERGRGSRRDFLNIHVNLGTDSSFVFLGFCAM